RLLFVPLDCLVQVAPPSVVRAMAPPRPTAHPVLASRKKMLRPPYGCGVQVAPPLVVCRRVPPIAQPVLASTNETASSSAVVPLVWLVQLTPPSAVWRMVPPYPTAHPVLASTKVTANKTRSPMPRSCWVQVAPPSVVLRMISRGGLGYTRTPTANP